MPNDIKSCAAPVSLSVCVLPNNYSPPIPTINPLDLRRPTPHLAPLPWVYPSEFCPICLFPLRNSDSADCRPAVSGHPGGGGGWFCYLVPLAHLRISRPTVSVHPGWGCCCWYLAPLPHPQICCICPFCWGGMVLWPGPPHAPPTPPRFPFCPQNPNHSADSNPNFIFNIPGHQLALVPPLFILRQEHHHTADTNIRKGPQHKFLYRSAGGEISQNPRHHCLNHHAACRSQRWHYQPQYGLPPSVAPWTPLK